MGNEHYDVLDFSGGFESDEEYLQKYDGGVRNLEEKISIYQVAL